MTPVPIRAFRADLRQHLARVARGERLTITYRGHPIAEVVPVGTTPDGADAETARTGEAPSTQSVLRRAVRVGLPMINNKTGDER